MEALLVVDVQYDFLPGGRLEVKKGDQILPKINALIPKMDLVVATQDWHPEGHSSFASSHRGQQPFDEITKNSQTQILWPDHCIQGSRGAKFSEALHSNPIEAIFRKGTDPEIDSYSGFYDNNHQKTTGLEAYLKGKGIDQIFVTGLAGDVCVYFTALDGLKEGFGVTVIRDACMPLDHDKFNRQLKELGEKGARIKKADEISI